MSLIYTLNVAKLFLLSIILKRDHPRAILQKFNPNWPSSFRRFLIDFLLNFFFSKGGRRQVGSWDKLKETALWPRLVQKCKIHTTLSVIFHHQKFCNYTSDVIKVTSSWGNWMPVIL